MTACTCGACRACTRHARHAAAQRRRNAERRHLPAEATQLRARRLVRAAIVAGELAPPNACDGCGAAPAPARDGRRTLDAHHDSYAPDRLLDVRWLCRRCHARWHVLHGAADQLPDSRPRLEGQLELELVNRCAASAALNHEQPACSTTPRPQEDTQ